MSARALALVAMILSLVGGPALAAPPLWTVSDADSTIYLFGAMHMLTPDTAWRSPAFDRALADSADVWLETDVQMDPREAARLMAELGIDAATPLAAKVDKRTMRAIRKALKGRPDVLARVEHMRPWAVALLLMVQPSTLSGQTPEAGADMTISRASAGAGKRRRYFETVEQQLRFFADLPEPTQLALLRETLFGRGGQGVLAMEADWQGGDFDTAGETFVRDMRGQWPDIYDVLLKRRNLNWADVLQAELAGQGTAMVNVGAFHLYGDDGLVALLRARGYRVERIQ